MKNHYDILGINRNASQDEIKTAYRKLSVKFHPDKNNGETFFAEMFKQVNEAYNTLYDRSKRANYDSELYNFEHPPKLTGNYSSTTTANSKANTPPPASYNYTNNNANYSSVWDGVRRWRNIRNYLLAINGILIFILFIDKSGNKQEQNITPTRDSSPIVKPTIAHRYKHKKRLSQRLTQLKLTITTLYHMKNLSCL